MIGSVTKLVADSPEVRRLLADAENQDDENDSLLRQLPREQGIQRMHDMAAHPERYMAERRKFLDAMLRLPGVVVSGEQYFSIVGQSAARCADDPLSTSFYLLVRTTTGPAKGSEGWACSRDVQPLGP
jgi:hypothetical protein